MRSTGGQNAIWLCCCDLNRFYADAAREGMLVR